MAAPDNSSEPRSIGRYQVLSLLGSGAMGRVLLAEDPRIKRRLAIKVLRMDSLRDPAERHETLLRFQREAEVSGLLNHPGIVAIYDVGEEPDLGPFLAMEFVPGRPLDGLIKDGPALGIPEKLLIAAGLAAALDHAHAKGIVHRDLKPRNIMVHEIQPNDPPLVKVVDFGLMRLLTPNTPLGRQLTPPPVPNLSA
ncbi:MAG: protein kinase, partial [Acidobacteria bacterium]|nr:protein kinase [Acidobacteriota bacterium]